MPIITPKASSPFNGGSITNELIVNTAATTDQALELIGTRTSEHDVFRIDYPHTVLVIDSDGVGQLSSDDALAFAFTASGGTRANVAVNDAGVNGAGINLNSGFGIQVSAAGNTKTLFEVLDNANNSQVAATNVGLNITKHAAPADGDLVAGDCILWFDQTDGAGNTKLMVKAKSANGTVKTATILLA